jgi:nitrilase
VKDFLIGMSVCYDLRFPEFYKLYAKHGVDIICVPSAFTQKTGEHHWEVLLRARAIENLAYVLAPNQIGEDTRGIKVYGHSMIIDPWGTVLARASADKEEIIYARLDKNIIKETRLTLPGFGKI